MTTTIQFPSVVKGTLVTEVDALPPLGITVGTNIKLFSTLRQHPDRSVHLENEADPASSEVVVDVWVPYASNKTQTWRAGDLRAIAEAIVKHADALDEATTTQSVPA